MLESKFIEIRDSATTIPALAICLRQNCDLSDSENWLLGRAGYSAEGCILLIKLAEPYCDYDPYKWSGSRTIPEAHRFIEENWLKLKSGDVVDVQFILGETTSPKQTDRLYEHH